MNSTRVTYSLFAAVLAVLLSTSLSASSGNNAAPVVPAIPSSSSSTALDSSRGFAPIVSKVVPSVVGIIGKASIFSKGSIADLPSMPQATIEELFREFIERFGDNLPSSPHQKPAKTVGSGFIIEGKENTYYIVTNRHVVDGADIFQVVLSDGSMIQASLVGSDARTDLAVLKVASQKALPVLQWGDSNQVQVGDWVLAIGSPYGFNSTVTVGIISAKGRTVEERTGHPMEFFQTDVAINVGNSGGPLVNVAGGVVGINTAIFSNTGAFSGISFSIPANMAKNVVRQIIEKGYVTRGFLGVQVQPVDAEIAASMHLPAPQGALVATIKPNTPAAKGGIQPKDIILKINGTPIQTFNQVSSIVSELPPNQEAEIELWRCDSKNECKNVLLKCPIVAAPQDVSATEKARKDTSTASTILGLKLADLTEELKARFNLAPDAKGVVVLKVLPDSQAQQKDIREGDLIVSIDNQDIASYQDLERYVKSQRESKSNKRVVLLHIERHQTPLYVALSLAKEKSAKE